MPYSSSFHHIPYLCTILFILLPYSISLGHVSHPFFIFPVFLGYSLSFAHIPHPFSTFLIFLGYSLSFFHIPYNFGIFLILSPYSSPSGHAGHSRSRSFFLGTQQLLKVPPATFPRCCSNPCPGREGRMNTQQFLILKNPNQGMAKQGVKMEEWEKM